MRAERLAALYEQLEDVRATQEGVWSELRTPAPARTQEEHDLFWSEVNALEDEEDDLLEEISALGGEDPAL